MELAQYQEVDPKSKVLEEGEGCVEKIRNGIAYLSFTMSNGEKLVGEHDAARLATLGIREGRRFNVRTIDRDGNVVVEVEAIPDCEVPEEMMAALREDLERMIAEDPLTGDY